MLIAKIAVNGVHATSTKLGTLTSGMVGAKVQFSFNSSWDGLSKTAVFRCRDIVKDVLNIDSEVTIPHEVLARSGSALEVGVYGTNADGSLVIPTVWRTVDIVYGGADPSGDPSAELTPGAVDQMMIILAETKKAAEEAHQKAADAVKPYTLRAEDAAAASGQFANASNMSAESAGKHEANARASENNAKNSAQSAEQSARNALSSEQNALNSANNAATSEQNADQSSKAAATSEQNVAAAAAAAAKSAKNAKASEDNSKATWDFAKDEARAAEAARKAAEDAAADASVSKNATLQAAEQASIDAQSAKNSATRADQVLDAALSVQTAAVGQFLIVEEVNENGKPIRWKGVDRTHWTEGRGKVEILPECQPTYIPDDRIFSLEFASSLSNLVAGETYIVNWNGVEYPSVAVDGAAIGEPGIKLLGDVYTLSEGAVGTAPTGEPFVMAMALEQGVTIVPFDGTTELTLSIYQSGEIVHKLDNKYLDLDWMPSANKAVLIPEQRITDSTINNKLTTDFIPTDGQKVVVYFEGVRLPGVVGTDGEKTWITPRGFLGNMGDYFYVTTIPYPELDPDYKTDNSFYLHYTETDGWNVVCGATCVVEFSIAVCEETAEELPEVFMPAGFVSPNMRCVYSMTENLSTSHWKAQDGYYMGLQRTIDCIPSDAVYCIAIPDADSRKVANIANIRAAVFNDKAFCCMADRLPTANVTVTFYFYALT